MIMRIPKIMAVRMSSSLDPIFDTAVAHREGAAEALRKAAERRILVLDGAMGTQIQALRLQREPFPRRAISRRASATCRATTTF